MDMSTDDVCLRCMKRGHRAKACKEEISCHYCKKTSHVSALCRKQFPDQTRRTQVTFADTGGQNESDSDEYNYSDGEEYDDEPDWEKEQEAPEEGNGQSEGESIYIAHPTNKSRGKQQKHSTSLLLTALTKAISPETGEERTVQVFLDTGAGKSFIKEKLVSELKLCAGDRLETTIGTFGGDKAHKIDCGETEFELLLKNGKKLKLTALKANILTPVQSSDSKIDSFRAERSGVRLI